jgi:hypothetical protein
MVHIVSKMLAIFKGGGFERSNIRFVGRRCSSGGCCRREAGHCHNCQTPLSGPFCQACGQKAGHLHKPIWELTHDFVHSVLHWDGRIWVTLRAMMFTPAKHANDWINGRQMRYVPPIRLFVFVSLMIIALLSFTDVVHCFACWGLLMPQQNQIRTHASPWNHFLQSMKGVFLAWPAGTWA